MRALSTVASGWGFLWSGRRVEPATLTLARWRNSPRESGGSTEIRLRPPSFQPVHQVCPVVERSTIRSGPERTYLLAADMIQTRPSRRESWGCAGVYLADQPKPCRSGMAAMASNGDGSANLAAASSSVRCPAMAWWRTPGSFSSNSSRTARRRRTTWGESAP